MITHKKCKGQGKAKSVKGCGKLTNVKYRRYGLCTSCYADFILNTDYGKILLEKATLKATKPRRELEKVKEETKNRKSLSKELQKTQTLVNKYVRLRDTGKPCISQNIPYKKDFDAGHLFSKNTYSAIRFNLDNIHGQSIYANRYLEGDFDNYLINLPSRIGKERVESLKQLAAECKKTTKKWTIDELQEIQKDIKQKLTKL